MINDADIVVLEGARTPFGTLGGQLKDTSATTLGEIAATGAIGRAGVAPEEIDAAVFGNVMQTSRGEMLLARHVALAAGLGISTPALTVNRVCGSGLEAVLTAARWLLLGEASVVLAGGAENMSLAPHVIRGARWGLKLGECPMEDSLWEAFVDTRAGITMALTAEKLAEEYGISREEQDVYALRSHYAARDARERGALGEEIVPVRRPADRKGVATVFQEDEHIRPDTTLDALSKLKPRFKERGTVTAGNASGICDGAAALILTTQRHAQERGWNPLARLVSWAVVGVNPEVMGIGPAPAIRKALSKAGLPLESIDLFEINEAFAAEYLAVEKELDLDRTKVNVNGGAIAIGHPLGASGARLALTLLYELRRRQARYGITALCIGGGQGIAAVWDRPAYVR